MDQNPNTPPPNPNQRPLMGFAQYSHSPQPGEFMTLLTQGGVSPNIPNQPQYSPMASPPIPFQNIQQNFQPQGAIFNQNFNDPRTFAHPQYQQPFFYGGTTSSAQHPQQAQQEMVPETQMPPSQETVPET